MGKVQHLELDWLVLEVDEATRMMVLIKRHVSARTRVIDWPDSGVGSGRYTPM